MPVRRASKGERDLDLDFLPLFQLTELLRELAFAPLAGAELLGQAFVAPSPLRSLKDPMRSNR